MAVSVDVATGSIRTTTTDPWTFSHVAGASPKAAVLVGAHGATNTDKWGTVTYGGVTMTRRITSATGSGGIGNIGMCALWDLLADVPGGTQTVSIDYTGFDDDDAVFALVTLNADDLIERIDLDEIEDTNAANPSLTMQYGGRSAYTVGSLMSATSAPGNFTPNGSTTVVTSSDGGSWSVWALRANAVGTSDLTLGGTLGSDWHCMVAAAYSQILSTAAPRHGFVDFQNGGVF